MVKTATDAIVEVAKCHQKEQEHICVNASKFEKYVSFFKATLTEEAMITMSLNFVCRSLEVHAVGIKRPKPLWDAFLCEIARLDNIKPMEISGSQAPWKRPSIAVEVEYYGGVILRVDEMAREIASMN